MEKDLQNAKYIRMTTQPVEKLIGQMAVPSIVSMMVSAIYNMVDTMFVGRISTEATAGVGVVFSFMALIQALAFYFGHGSANYISRALGKRESDKATEVANTGFFSTEIVALVIVVLGLVFMNPWLRFLGATDSVLADSRAYFLFILIGTPFIMGSYALNLQMRMQGNASVAMVGIASGAVLNVALDPLFIFGFRLGVMGASLATAVSQLVSFVVLFSMAGRKGGIKLDFRSFRPRWWHYTEINAGGLPSLARQGLGSIATICLNRIAGGYGDAVLAAFSIVNKTVMFSTSALLGFGQGFQPVCGFNYGAEKFDRVKRAFWFSTSVATAYAFVMALLGFTFAPSVVAFFRDDATVIMVGTKILRYYCLSYVLHGFIIITNMYLQNIRKTIPASIVSMSRQGLLLIPPLFLLNALLGLEGVMFAQPMADALTFVLCIPFASLELKRMGSGK